MPLIIVYFLEHIDTLMCSNGHTLGDLFVLVHLTTLKSQVTKVLPLLQMLLLIYAVRIESLQESLLYSEHGTMLSQ